MKNSLFFKIIVLSICCTFFFPFISFAEISSNLVTTEKIDSNLSVKLQELSDSEKVSVYVYMSDDSNDVISSMEQNYPNLYTTYTSARTGNDTNLKYSVNTSRNQNMLISAEAEVLQNSLEVKRQLYNTHYSSKNTTLLAKHCSDESLLYVSSYSPMAIVSVTTSELKKMMLDPDKVKLELL